LRAKEKLSVVATPFITSAVGHMALRSMPTVCQAAVGEDADAFVSEMIQADVVVEIGLITSDDEDPAEHLRIDRYSITWSARASSEGGMVRRSALAVFR
jgi:hypothetical protein